MKFIVSVMLFSILILINAPLIKDGQLSGITSKTVKSKIIKQEKKISENNERTEKQTQKTVQKVEPQPPPPPPSVPTQALIDAPLINQMPELARGCEVTSLAMMLQFAGVKVDKMTLANQVKKDPTLYQVINGVVHFGNPHDGFVGDMYSFNQPGLAVYHEPIAQLANQYLPGRIKDISGGDFSQVIDFLNKGKPVWVINNVLFDTVPASKWETWETPSGQISITYEEHSVLVTGYDSQFIYFNDPLAGIKNRKISRDAFQRGWEQMGKQAISYE